MSDKYKYIKNPSEIMAIEWDGNITMLNPLWEGCTIPYVEQDFLSDDLKIPTLEGVMTAKSGDFIVRGIKGELYPVKPDIFNELHTKKSDYIDRIDQLTTRIAELETERDILIGGHDQLTAALAASQAECKRLNNALTPSAETKRAYMGEFSVPLPEMDEAGNEYIRSINVPWTTIKKIMQAIKEQP